MASKPRTETEATLRRRARVFALRAWLNGVAPSDVAAFARGLGLPLTAKEYLRIARAYVDALDEAALHGGRKI